MEILREIVRDYIQVFPSPDSGVPSHCEKEVHREFNNGSDRLPVDRRGEHTPHQGICSGHLHRYYLEVDEGTGSYETPFAFSIEKIGSRDGGLFDVSDEVEHREI